MAEGAEDAPDGGVCRDQGGHCRVIEEEGEFGACEGGTGEDAGDVLAEPVEGGGQAVFGLEEGFGGWFAGACARARGAGAAGDEAVESLRQAAETRPHDEDEGPGDALLAPLNDDAPAQVGHDRFETIGRRRVGWVGGPGQHRAEISTMGGGVRKGFVYGLFGNPDRWGRSVGKAEDFDFIEMQCAVADQLDAAVARTRGHREIEMVGGSVRAAERRVIEFGGDEAPVCLIG